LGYFNQLLFYMSPYENNLFYSLALGLILNADPRNINKLILIFVS